MCIELVDQFFSLILPDMQRLAVTQNGAVHIGLKVNRVRMYPAAVAGFHVMCQQGQCRVRKGFFNLQAEQCC